MRLLTFLFSSLVLMTVTPAWAGLKVVTSFKPVHSLVAAVMQGVGTPDLLVTGAASPHTYALKPSDAEKLSKADMVFWMGPDLEAFLEKPIVSLASHAQSIELLHAEGVEVLPPRSGPGFADDGDHDTVDPHAWLAPDNAIHMVRAIADSLSASDPANAARYAVNAASETDKIKAAKSRIAAKLAALPKSGFISFHDAYQYFEKSFGLASAGTIAIHPDNPPGAASLLEKRKLITSAQVKCVFAEPSFDPKLVNILTEGSHARGGILDPEGALQEPGPDLYVNVLEALATSLADCLS